MLVSIPMYCIVVVPLFTRFPRREKLVLHELAIYLEESRKVYKGYSRFRSKKPKMDLPLFFMLI